MTACVIFSPSFASASAFNFDKIRSEEHTSEPQSHHDLVCRLLLEKKTASSRCRRLVLTKLPDLSASMDNRRRGVQRLTLYCSFDDGHNALLGYSSRGHPPHRSAY